MAKKDKSKSKKSAAEASHSKKETPSPKSKKSEQVKPKKSKQATPEVNATVSSASAGEAPASAPKQRLSKKQYEAELLRLQVELVKLTAWVKEKQLRVVVLFEGRDAAGKGGAIKRITEAVSPRLCRVVALSAPSEREKGQWYFQRYVAQLPSAGEVVLFDRSWYNRAGVERVMGFCNDAEYQEFFRTVPDFERMLIRSRTILVKYWFSVSDTAQEERFQERNHSPIKRWKLSPMDLESRSRWVEYSKAKDEMFKYTDLQDSPWWVVEADDKRRARLNCISHFLSCVPYEDLTPQPVDLPPRDTSSDYVRPPMAEQRFVPDVL